MIQRCKECKGVIYARDEEFTLNSDNFCSCGKGSKLENCTIAASGKLDDLSIEELASKVRDNINCWIEDSDLEVDTRDLKYQDLIVASC